MIMKYIDVHCHIFPSAIAGKVIDALETFYGYHWQGTGALDDLLRSIRKAGINKSVIFSSATKPAQVPAINQFIHTLQSQYPELFIGFGTMHPEYPHFREEIAKMCDLGLNGFKFHPDFQQFCIDDERMLPVYEEAEKRNMTLLFHIGDYRTPYSKPERLKRIHKMFPSLKLIAAHMGGYSEWEQAWQHLIGEEIYLDVSSTMFSLSPQEVRKMVQAHGIDKVLFASDYPAVHHRKAVEDVLRMGFSREDNEKIFYKNAEKLLNITL